MTARPMRPAMTMRPVMIMPASPGAAMSMCFAALARMNRAASVHAGKVQEAGSVRRLR